MENLNVAFAPIFNLIYLAAALVVVAVIDLIIYERNRRRHGCKQAYGTGWAFSIPAYAVVFGVWAWYVM